MSEMEAEAKRILAVASDGGHWIQLLRLRPAFEGHDVAYLTTDSARRPEIGSARFYAVRDGNRSTKLALAASAVQICRVLLRERPDIVISTGAAPGWLAIRCGKVLGARTVWIDSLANAHELSMSGRLASEQADLCLTQWSHLAEGPVAYMGSVL
jgi:UDP-N-acetylglucosamine:LPS N-acetylglucosamine transferase